MPHRQQAGTLAPSDTRGHAAVVGGPPCGCAQARLRRSRAGSESGFDFAGSESGFDFAGSWSQTGNNPTSSERAYRQWLTAPPRCAIINPLLFSYKLSVSRRLARAGGTELPDTLKHRTFGWTAGAQILQALPVSMSLSTSRTRGTTGGGFTSQGGFSASNFSSSLKYTNRYLPASLTHSTKGGNSDRSLEADMSADMSVGAVTLSVRCFYNVRFEPSSATRSRVTVRVVRRF